MKLFDKLIDKCIDSMAIKPPKGLFVGLCTKDILFYTDALPAENHKAKTSDFAAYIGGPAANAAITYAALGGDATLATCLGDGAESRAMKSKLEDFGVKVLNYSEYDTLPNLASIAVTKGGMRTILSGQQAFQVNRDFDLTPYDFALFDCNQQEISLDILQKLGDTPVVLDAGSFKPNIEKFLERADIVIASEDFKDEAGNDVFGMKCCDAKYKAITRGERPILCNGKELSVDKVEVVDTLGAGDIFHGAFCFALFEKEYAFEEALLFAARVASESVKYRGPREWMNQMEL